MSSNFLKLNQTFAENCSCLFHKDPKNAARIPQNQFPIFSKFDSSDIFYRDLRWGLLPYQQAEVQPGLGLQQPLCPMLLEWLWFKPLEGVQFQGNLLKGIDNKTIRN